MRRRVIRRRRRAVKARLFQQEARILNGVVQRLRREIDVMEDVLAMLREAGVSHTSGPYRRLADAVIELHKVVNYTRHGGRLLASLTPKEIEAYRR